MIYLKLKISPSIGANVTSPDYDIITKLKRTENDRRCVLSIGKLRQLSVDIIKFKNTLDGNQILLIASNCDNLLALKPRNF